MTRAPLLTVPCLDLDEAPLLVGSWELRRGGTLYVDFVDTVRRSCTRSRRWPSCAWGAGCLR